jgi:hypothetical protein
MPKQSIADLITGFENLVATVKVSAADAPGLSVHIGPLEQLLADLKALNASIDTRKGVKQQGVQERRALIKQGKDLASQARAALKAHFGLRNERLVEFGAKPVRARRKTPKTTPEEPEPAPETPAPTATPSTEVKTAPGEGKGKTQ